MAFEFFFGLFGLISCDSSWRSKTQLDTDWRLFTPLGSGLFRGEKGAGSAGSATPSAGSPVSFKSLADLQRPPAYGSAGALATANNSVSSGLLSASPASSSSSTTSIASSSSATSTASSTATLIKAGPQDILDTISGKRNALVDAAAGLSDDEKLDASLEPGADQAEGAARPASSRARSLYCALVCLSLWLQVLRTLLGLVVEKSLVTLDFYYLGASRTHFLVPAMCLAIQAAAVSLVFIRNDHNTNWLVPFYSSKDYLIRSRSNFRPRMEDYRQRVRTSVTLALSLATLGSFSLAAYLVQCVLKSDVMQEYWFGAQPAHATPTSGELGGGGGWSAAVERAALSVLLVYDVLWALYSTYICFLVAFYFNLICSIMKARFHGISKIIEDLTESNTAKTTNQARKITTLYLEHNEACELLDESNDFWQYLIFFTYFTYIPAYCYCLYNLFFVDFEAWPSFVTWVIHTHTGFIILLISFSAAGVSTEAHAPYTSLHTLSLIQLPLDVEVNIATFLHRVRGLTIGYSCYDLFAITNGSMSNTAAACASYFLIVADFNRSSVFTMAQMNNTGGSPQAAGSTQAPTSAPAL